MSVSQVQYSPDGQTWNTLSWVPIIDGKQSFRLVPPISGQDSFGSIWGWPRAGWLKFTYLNGFANAALTANVAAAATSLTVDDPSGVAGASLTIYTAAAEETVTVAPGYVAGSTTLPLVSATLYAHNSGDRISAMPANAREATLLIVSELARQKGYQAITVMPGGKGRVMTAQMTAGSSPMQMLDEMIQPLRRVV